MIYPPIYSIAKNDSGVTAIFGVEPRLYPFAEAPQAAISPYAVWQIVSGEPENYLGNRPDSDHHVVQVDVYGNANKPSIVRNAASALMYALEAKAYITRYADESIDPDTKEFRVSFDVKFISTR